MKKNLHSNIWKYTLFLISNKRVFVAILGAYYLTIPNVTPEGIGIILLVGNLAGFLFEIPSGYVSDKIGHKTALIMSRAFMLTSTLLFLVANNIVFLIFGGVLMSMAHAFHSGTGSAFMHETLRGLKRENDYAKVMGKISSIGFAIPIIFMVLIPFLVSISFKTPFLIALAIDIIGILAAIALVTPPVKQEEIEEIGRTNFRQIISEGHRLNFFIFALFSGIISGAVFSVSVFRAPYQLFLEIPVIWFGVLFGVGRMLASLILAYTGKIKETTSLFSFYKFQLIIYTFLIFVLGFISTWWIVAVAFIVINAFQWGLNKVDNSYLLDIIKTSKFKATLLSTHSQINQVVAAIASFGVGFTIEHLSYQYGFLYLGIIFFVILFPLYLYINNKHKKINTTISGVK